MFRGFRSRYNRLFRRRKVAAIKRLTADAERLDIVAEVPGLAVVADELAKLLDRAGSSAVELRLVHWDTLRTFKVRVEIEN